MAESQIFENTIQQFYQLLLSFPFVTIIPMILEESSIAASEAINQSLTLVFSVEKH